MAKQNIIDKLRETLERTGYVTPGSVEIFQGEFHEDSRQNIPPYISYILSTKNREKDTKLHLLEKNIRYGFFDGHYSDCNLTTSIQEISETEERHTINIIFSEENPQNQGGNSYLFRKKRELRDLSLHTNLWRKMFDKAQQLRHPDIFQ